MGRTRKQHRFLFAEWAEPVAPTLHLKHNLRRQVLADWMPQNGLSMELFSVILTCLSRPHEEEATIRADLANVQAVLKLAEYTDASRAMAAIAALALVELDCYGARQIGDPDTRRTALARCRAAVLRARKAFCLMFDRPASWDALAAQCVRKRVVTARLTDHEADAFQRLAREHHTSPAELMRALIRQRIGFEP
jgi:hypothetical protein